MTRILLSSSTVGRVVEDPELGRRADPPRIAIGLSPRRDDLHLSVVGWVADPSNVRSCRLIPSVLNKSVLESATKVTPEN